MISKQFITFACIGLLSAAIDIGSMQGLLVAGVHHTAAVSLGFLLSLGVNYLGHTLITFRSSSSLRSALSFSVVVLMNYLITMILTSLSFHYFETVMPGKLISLFVVAVNGFLLSKYWVFR